MGDKEKDESERPLLLFAVWTLSHSVGGLLDQAFRDAPLNPDEYGFYSAVHENQPATPATLAAVAGMPTTTVSSYLSRLIDRGHISKTRNPSDGRSFLVELTPSGMKALEENSLRFVPAQDAVIETLSLPVERVMGTLEKLTEAVKTATAAAAKLASSPVNRE
jgi:DNA-binding MarR family transcriptional regulator